MPLRLRKLRDGQGWLRRLQFAVMPWTVGFPANDVVRTLAYRPGFFGSPFSALLQSVLRGRSPWTVAERELFASFVSSQNQCVF